MTTNSTITTTYTLDTNDTIDYSNTMYYTTSTGTISKIDTTYNLDKTSDLFTAYHDYFKYQPKDFEHMMPDLFKVEEMCKMYPALDKAFENFKAVYNLVKDDYEARKNNDT